MRMLTRIQQNVLDAVYRRVDQGEAAPTYRELCAEFGWASTGTVRDHLRALARKGYLQLAGRSRQVRLLEQRAPVTRVPLVGRVVAGVPAISEESVGQRIPVPATWTGRGTFFALRVAGDSMRDAGILEGDQVIVRQQRVAIDGDVVIATLEGETTLKRLRIEHGRPILIAENPKYPPIEIGTDEPIIQGVVVGLMRKYRDYGAAASRQAGRFRRAAPGGDITS